MSKVLFLVLLLTLLAGPVFADETYQRYGNILYGSDGRTYQTYGNITYGSDGSVYQRYGGTTFVTPGSSGYQPLSESIVNPGYGQGRLISPGNDGLIRPRR